ncbi:hypothetical protein DFQ29_010210 [Apophysomyces sp. BC1021]|nr:hypothetical protein DFQ29_010210 [Apophysomyces sp. BC1021]
MKFAKQIETAATDLPMDWRPHLIQYKLLKKSIHLVVDELKSRGLSSQLLTEIVHSPTQSYTDMVKMAYVFDGDAKDPHPCINITIDDPASFSASEKLRAHLDTLQKLIPCHPGSTEPLLIKIELVRDSEFFHQLLEELSHAATLHDSEKERFNTTVNELEIAMAVAASPYKKDMYTWREIFKLYMEASVFQNEQESKCTVQSFERSKERLCRFTQELTRTKLAKKLTLKRSRVAFKQFLAINANLVDFKYFQALNQMAMTKIRNARAEFPVFAKNNTVFVEGILISLYNAIQTKLVTIVPQPEDYGCPVCYGISRDSRHKRSNTGARRVQYRKKRKFELGRQPASTKLGAKRIHLVRVRGGNTKHRALRLDSGNFSWGSEGVARKTRVLTVVYNASNNELVRTNTLVKGAVIQIDATPFRQWYESHYAITLGKKKAGTETEAAADKKSNSVQKKIEARKSSATVDSLLADQFNAGRLYAIIASRPGQSGRCDGYILEGKELEFYVKKIKSKKH